MGEAAKKRKNSFFLEWEDIKPPPGADPKSKWRRCHAGCTECGYNTVSESMIGRMRPETKIEEQVLDILRFSAIPIYCLHYTAFIIAYAQRGDEQKAIANRLSAAVLQQMKIIDQMKEDEKYAKPKRSKKSHRRKRPASRRRQPSRKRKAPTRTDAGAGVSGRDGRKAARPAKRDRGVAKKAGVRDSLEKRGRKTDADGD
jgi:hypothetical protein